MIVENSAITIEQLSAQIGVTTRSIERNLKKLQTDDRIRRVGPDKGGHWEIVDE